MPIKEGQNNMTTTPPESHDSEPFIEQRLAEISYVKNLTTDHLGCRRGALGHGWRYVTPDWKPRIKGVTAVAKQCHVCKTVVRYNISTRLGEKLDVPRYQYPIGYRLSKDPDGARATSGAVSAEFARRMRKAVLPDMEHVPMVAGEDE